MAKFGERKLLLENGDVVIAKCGDKYCILLDNMGQEKDTCLLLRSGYRCICSMTKKGTFEATRGKECKAAERRYNKENPGVTE